MGLQCRRHHAPHFYERALEAVTTRPYGRWQVSPQDVANPVFGGSLACARRGCRGCRRGRRALAKGPPLHSLLLGQSPPRTGQTPKSQSGPLRRHVCMCETHRATCAHAHSKRRCPVCTCSVHTYNTHACVTHADTACTTHTCVHTAHHTCTYRIGYACTRIACYVCTYNMQATMHLMCTDTVMCLSVSVCPRVSVCLSSAPAAGHGTLASGGTRGCGLRKSRGLRAARLPLPGDTDAVATPRHPRVSARPWRRVSAPSKGRKAPGTHLQDLVHEKAACTPIRGLPSLLPAPGDEWRLGQKFRAETKVTSFRCANPIPRHRQFTDDPVTHRADGRKGQRDPKHGSPGLPPRGRTAGVRTGLSPDPAAIISPARPAS